MDLRRAPLVQLRHTETPSPNNPLGVKGAGEGGTIPASAAIVSAIEDCHAMVLVFSAHANESPHIRREVERAVSKGKFIVPFRIENVLPSRAMEYCLRRIIATSMKPR